MFLLWAYGVSACERSSWTRFVSAAFCVGREQEHGLHGFICVFCTMSASFEILEQLCPVLFRLALNYWSITRRAAAVSDLCRFVSWFRASWSISCLSSQIGHLRSTYVASANGSSLCDLPIRETEWANRVCFIILTLVFVALLALDCAGGGGS